MAEYECIPAFLASFCAMREGACIAMDVCTSFFDDISPKKVAPHCSRGRFTEGFGKVFVPAEAVDLRIVVCDFVRVLVAKHGY